MKLWRYHKDFPEGKVFDDTTEEYRQAINQGWVDSPSKIGEVKANVTFEKEPYVFKEPEEKKVVKRPGPRKGFRNASKK